MATEFTARVEHDGTNADYERLLDGLSRLGFYDVDSEIVEETPAPDAGQREPKRPK